MIAELMEGHAANFALLMSLPRDFFALMRGMSKEVMFWNILGPRLLQVFGAEGKAPQKCLLP